LNHLTRNLRKGPDQQIVGSIKSLRAHSINMTHDSLEVSLGCLKGQVVVGFHEATGKYPNIPPAPILVYLSLPTRHRAT